MSTQKWQLGYGSDHREHNMRIKEQGECGASGPHSLREVRGQLLTMIAEDLTGLWERMKVHPNTRQRVTVDIVVIPAAEAYPGRIFDETEN